jgi:hypothetical protein
MLLVRWARYGAALHAWMASATQRYKIGERVILRPMIRNDVMHVQATVASPTDSAGIAVALPSSFALHCPVLAAVSTLTPTPVRVGRPSIPPLHSSGLLQADLISLSWRLGCKA